LSRVTYTNTVGYGVLGKAYTEAFTAKGNKVHILEANQEFVDMHRKDLDIYHISEDISHLANVDFITIMVCTPLNKDGRLNMNYLYSTLPNVSTILKNNPECMVLIRSTVQPMFTRDYTNKLRELLPGQAVHVAFQPEFLRAVSSHQDAMHPWLVVLGSTDLPQTYKDRFFDLYAQYVSRDKIVELSTEEAELHKIAHNCIFTLTQVSTRPKSPSSTTSISSPTPSPPNTVSQST
jgi:UDPglucose 6-dehydrogenase